MPYFIIFINALLMSTGQIFFKKAALFINAHSELNIVKQYLFNPYFILGVATFGIATLTWTKILTTMKLSIAYPLMSLSYIFTAIGAYYIFNEKLSYINIIGILLIIAGVALLSAK